MEHFTTVLTTTKYSTFTNIVCVVEHVELLHITRQLVVPEDVLLHEAELELLAASNVERVDAGSQMSSDAERLDYRLQL